MYIPAAFRSDDPDLAWQLVEDIRFGCLISGGLGLMASHLPFMVERGDAVRLVGHVARANPQWKELEASPVLVNFLGPNTHISPSWYTTSPRAPTWNYVAVQVRGRVRVTEDRETLRRMVLDLSALMEPDGSPWEAAKLDIAYIDKLLPGIVGFAIEVDHVDVQLRLSQQNNADDQRKVRAALGAGSLRERQVAETMTRYLGRLPE
ncbi:FMN-binding negative transcriptional regulator [Tardiphaga alba]|uniref:FMN-binding negative transcriptional regulator n=1 Tax=Tardiphaga alba TaxID=340268 RepID=A0ABX8ABW7_9BRAD|nr:FMN-binding negative transcriptional regulator [Tardiphaga alba]QUS39895.1 FMN-binding negative transcriptional regulator [Tardiphaga alba]